MSEQLDGYLFDTCILPHYFGQHVNVMARIDRLPDNAGIYYSAITLGEIEFGHMVTQSTEPHKREEYARFINDRENFPFAVEVTRDTAMHYGDLKARLFKAFPPKSPAENHPERCIDKVTGAELGIDENDLWITAQAIERGLVLVTTDKMDKIRSVAGPLVDVQNWLLPLQGG